METNYKIYAQVTNGIVTKVFCDAFEQPTDNDILLEETSERHKANTYEITNGQGIYTKSIVDGKLVDRDITADLQRNANAQRVAELKQLLADTDYKQAKMIDGRMTEEEYAPIKEQRRLWWEEIKAKE